jgi:hypothetical protein
MIIMKDYPRGKIDGRREAYRQVIRMIDEMECKSVLHGIEPCDLHPKLIDGDELRKKLNSNPDVLTWDEVIKKLEDNEKETEKKCM